MGDFTGLILPTDAESHLDDPDCRIVDCRFDLSKPHAGHAAFFEAHIPGAVYADLNKDLAAPLRPDTGRHPLPDIAVLESTFGSLGIGGDTEVIVYDSGSGAMAARAWWLLRWLGHTHVTLLDGGFARWQAMDLPIESGAFGVAARQFRGAPRPAAIITTQELVALGASVEAMRLVDARDVARFRGEAEPIDAVAGHIPGALNLPFSESLNSDGTWKAKNELRRMWARVLGDDPGVPWAVMCGSGVTACHLALSGLLAGYREPRVYVGSWSEWIRDPERPVASDGD